jgi:hypothetical protein
MTWRTGTPTFKSHWFSLQREEVFLLKHKTKFSNALNPPDKNSIRYGDHLQRTESKLNQHVMNMHGQSCMVIGQKFVEIHLRNWNAY